MISWKFPLSGTCWNPGEHSFRLVADTLSAGQKQRCQVPWWLVAGCSIALN
jgi:hypothetical protein